MTWMAPLWRRLRAHRGPTLDGLQEGCFCALDLEATGLDPRREAIVAAAAVEFVHGQPGRSYVTLVDPRRSIPPEATAVHGITDAMVAGAPSPEATWRELRAMLGDRVLVGHGVAFDLALLGRVARAAALPPPVNVALDTRALAAAIYPGQADLSLETIAARVGVQVEGRHTAEGDALTAGRIFYALLPAFQALGVRSVAELAWVQAAGRLPR
jgi:DNA polymerase III epsilon subunit-like protein